MSDTVTAAVIGLAGGLSAALVTAGYTVGGRGALQRRVIRQEAEIAALLPKGRAQSALLVGVDARLAIYQARRIPYTSLERQRASIRFWRVAIVASFTSLGAAFLMGTTHGAWFVVATSVWSVGFFALGVVSGWVTGRQIREWLRIRDERRLGKAIERLGVTWALDDPGMSPGQTAPDVA
jgi:hypothetical protein